MKDLSSILSESITKEILMLDFQKDKSKFQKWMLSTPENLILAILLETEDQRKSALITVQQESEKYCVTCFTRNGAAHKIRSCSRKKTFDSPSQFETIKKAASFLHQKIHKQNHPYKIIAEYMQDYTTSYRWMELSTCQPCEVPFKQDVAQHCDEDFLYSLDLLEL